MINRPRKLLLALFLLTITGLRAQTSWTYGLQNDTALISTRTGEYAQQNTETFNLCTGLPVPNQQKGVDIVQRSAPYQMEDGTFYVTKSERIKRLDTWTVKSRIEYSVSKDPSDKDNKAKLDRKFSRLMEDATMLGYHTRLKEFIIVKDEQIIAVNPHGNEPTQRLLFDFAKKLRISDYRFSPAGNYLVITSSYPSVKNYLIDLSLGKLYLDLDLSVAPGEMSYAFRHDDGQIIVNDVDDKAYRLYQLPERTLVEEYSYALFTKIGDRPKVLYFDQQHLYLIMGSYTGLNGYLKVYKPITYPVVQVFKRGAGELSFIRQYQLKAGELDFPPFDGTKATETKTWSYTQLPADHQKLLSYFKPIQTGFTLSGLEWNSKTHLLVPDSTLLETWCLISCAYTKGMGKMFQLHALGKLTENDSTLWILLAAVPRNQVLEEGKPFAVNYSVHQYDKVHKRFRGNYELGKRYFDPHSVERMFHITIYENRYQEIHCVTPVNNYKINKKL